MQEYSSGFTSERLLHHEMKIVLTLKSEGKSDQETRQAVLEHNLFQYTRERTIISTLRLINKRIVLLDETLQKMFLTNGHSDRLAIILFTFLQIYRLPQ